ncbi:hypothetical protein D5086_002538 [Populus alba]|uniref:Uncharacterized protein n=1 Tax=Populus alba TaxID=43335 RepID=A0ACC4D2B0_POPAL
MSSDKGAMDVYYVGSFPDIENALELNLILKQNPDVKKVLYHKMSSGDLFHLQGRKGRSNPLSFVGPLGWLYLVTVANTASSAKGNKDGKRENIFGRKRK